MYIEIDFTLRTKFSKVELTKFWIELFIEFPAISLKALKIRLRFPTTYISEKTFSLSAATKNNFETDLTCNTT